MLYDLHTHSSISDGILSPEALVSRAKKNSVTHLALTDHDTVGGLEAAAVAATAQGVQLISGVELSTEWRGAGIHVLGLGIDPYHPSMSETLRSQAQARERRALEIGDRLARLGIKGAFEGARRIASGGTLGRPHFARFLVAEKIVPDVETAFKRYLGAGKTGDVKQYWLTMPEVIAAITESGGVAALAHPLKYKLTLTRLRRLVGAFKEAGGAAIEVCSGKQSTSETDAAARLATGFGLLASGGSDFHSPDKPWQELGEYTSIPAQCTPIWQLWERVC